MTARPDLAEIERLLADHNAHRHFSFGYPDMKFQDAAPDVVRALLARVRELEAIEREANEAILELQQQLCAQAGVPMPSERPGL